MLNRALPGIMRAQASAARSRGAVSIIGANIFQDAEDKRVIATIGVPVGLP
jgi:hypothetical protein